MLVRSLTQATRRTTAFSLRPPAFFTPNTYAAFNSAAIRRGPSVPLVTWTDGKRNQHEILSKQEQTDEVVKPVEGDLQRTAEPLDCDVYEKLTPTLNKFTLPGKVAVVTG